VGRVLNVVRAALQGPPAGLPFGPLWALVLLPGLWLLAGALAPAETARPRPTRFKHELPIPVERTGARIDIAIQQTEVELRAGRKTSMWTYDGTFPGPTIRRPSGQSTAVTFTNQLPASAGSMTVHNHGGHSPSSEDGQPDDFLIPPGGSRTYTYPLTEGGLPERAATQWYHDHRMDLTGRNVWMGLAGFFIIDDPVDAALPLPDGEFDIPLMIVDRRLNAKNQIPYSFDPDGVTGRHILVNGAIRPHLVVGDRKYRFRLLNASNTRTYELQLGNKQSMIQVGTDSGLSPAPVSRTRIRLGPAERAEVVIDFAGRLNQRIVLRNRAASGAASRIMQFRVEDDLDDDSSVPASLRPAPTLPEPEVTRTWDFGLDLDADARRIWTINGREFDPERVDAFPEVGATEKWIFRNLSEADHVIHVHGADWRLLTRNGGPPDPSEDGLKESFFLAPGESVAVVGRFTDHTGRFMLHCHMLEHEDRAMMTQFEVVP
jgi:spore coat protein A, manganese oxidase